jgi:hypothetical protein
VHHLVLGVRDHFGLVEEQQDDRLLDRADRERLIIAVEDQYFTREGWRGGMKIVVFEVGRAVSAGDMSIIRALKMLESVRARTYLASMIVLMLVALSVVI